MTDYTFPNRPVFAMPSFAGLRIIRDIHLTEVVEDWSRVRSPSRARRRRKLGHPQNIGWLKIPKREAIKIGDHTLVMHPETADAFERLMAKQADEIHDRMMAEACGVGESVVRTSLDAGGALTIEHIERARRLLW